MYLKLSLCIDYFIRLKLTYVHKQMIIIDK